MSNELRDAIAVLQRKRADAMAVVSKLDEALRVLRELDSDTPGGGGGSPGSGSAAPTAKLATSPSVLTRVVRLAEERNRTWTVAQILDEFERRDAPVQAKAPTNATRTALSAATQQGKLVRLQAGVYRAAKFKDESIDSLALGGVFEEDRSG